MPRLDPRSQQAKRQWRRGQDWAPFMAAQEPSAPLGRHLRVLIDEEEYPRQGKWSPEVLLGGLLADPLIDTLCYSDLGPPAPLQRTALPDGTSTHNEQFVEGWASVTQEAEAQADWAGAAAYVHVLAHWLDGEAFHSALVSGQGFGFGGLQDSTDPADESSATTPAQRRSDRLAAGVAAAVHADIFITSRAFLLSDVREQPPGVYCLTKEEALPLVSLFLRSCGTYAQETTDGRFRQLFDRSLWFSVAANACLPELQRWRDELRADDDRTMSLTYALAERLSRVLKIRDSYYVEVLGRQDSEDAIAHFDTICLYLMSMLDATARLIHLRLGLTMPLHHASWRRQDWRKALRKRSPGLADATLENNDFQNLINAVSALRNTIHSANLSTIQVSKTGFGVDRVLLDLASSLDASEAQALTQALLNLGAIPGTDVEELHAGRPCADPTAILELLCTSTVGIYRDVMPKLTSYLSATAAPATVHAPARGSPYGARSSASVFWQLGVAPS